MIWLFLQALRPGREEAMRQILTCQAYYLYTLLYLRTNSRFACSSQQSIIAFMQLQYPHPSCHQQQLKLRYLFPPCVHDIYSQGQQQKYIPSSRGEKSLAFNASPEAHPLLWATFLAMAKNLFWKICISWTGTAQYLVHRRRRTRTQSSRSEIYHTLLRAMSARSFTLSQSNQVPQV